MKLSSHSLAGIPNFILHLSLSCATMSAFQNSIRQFVTILSINKTRDFFILIQMDTLVVSFFISQSSRKGIYDPLFYH